MDDQLPFILSGSVSFYPSAVGRVLMDPLSTLSSEKDVAGNSYLACETNAYD
jgi:hypothetical protein